MCSYNVIFHLCAYAFLFYLCSFHLRCFLLVYDCLFCTPLLFSTCPLPPFNAFHPAPPHIFHFRHKCFPPFSRSPAYPFTSSSMYPFSNSADHWYSFQQSCYTPVLLHTTSTRFPRPFPRRLFQTPRFCMRFHLSFFNFCILVDPSFCRFYMCSTSASSTVFPR